jgi:glycosyltransferase involved in cell wall biosynthesis
MTPELACVVLSLRDQPGLAAAVRSLLHQSEPAEIVVVNSGGGEPRATLSTAGIEVPVVEWPERLLPGGARNLGVEATRAPYVAFLAADCLAEPGWIAGRLRAHRAGAEAVAHVMADAPPRTRSTCAAHLLLYNRQLPDTPPERRHFYGLSYSRGLLERLGPFREDMLAGEDTELNRRVDSPIAVTPDVRTAHRNPMRPASFLADQLDRGRRRADAERALHGRDVSSRLAWESLLNAAGAFREATRATDPAERLRLLSAWPLLFPGAAAFAAGALQARWRQST